jgi:hypothetical protein
VACYNFAAGMTILRSHKDFRPIQQLGFCYLCGEPFTEVDASTGDHVPPRSIFARADRAPPLKLPVHDKCNQGQSQDDEVIGQLISLLHGKTLTKAKQRFRAVTADLGDKEPFVGVTDLPLPKIIWRWVRGFHAALYREPLPLNSYYSLMSPFPAADQTAGGLKFEDLRLDQLEMALTLRQHIKHAMVDEVRCYAEKCRFVCTWLTADDGRPLCLYGLRIYEWEKLADTKRFPQRGCIGVYMHPTPVGATIGTKIILPITAFAPFDPFQ